MADIQVSDGMAVGIHFTLKLDTGEVVDSSEGSDPLQYLHGCGNIVPGLEAKIAGRGLGEKFSVSVPPEGGFGPREAPVEIPRGDFPADATLSEGMELQLESEDGHVVDGRIEEIGESIVKVDVNHPLAGQNLHFEVEVCSLRAATAEEMEQGHIQGLGGQS